MRKLVTVRKISELLPIEGADAIELAVVDGWKCVVRKGEFSVGDFGVYFEIDSFLPSTDSRFESFMKNSREYLGEIGHKLRTIRLRGQISQGLVMPVNVFPEILSGSNMSDELTDFAEAIGIVKWEPPVSTSVAGHIAGSFPSYIPKTNQERHQNSKNEIFGYEDKVIEFNSLGIPPESLLEMEQRGQLIIVDGQYSKILKAKAHRDSRYEVSLKLDGTSCTYFKYNGEVGVCSRNLQLKIDEENMASNALVKLFIDSGLSDIFNTYQGNIAIQGELMGTSIQGNRENLKHHIFYIFDVFNIDSSEFFTPDKRNTLYMNFIDLGVNSDLVKHVPVIAHSETLQELGIIDTESLIQYAEGKSINHPIREGVVFKRIDGKFSFKSISNTFLAKEKD